MFQSVSLRVRVFRVRTHEEQLKMFWQQADFGYVDERRKELTVLCEPQTPVSPLHH